MSISELKRLVPPPKAPREVGTMAEWRQVEQKLGIKLPRDYRAFVFAYGSGLFAGFYRVYNPFARGKYTSLVSSVKRICDMERETRKDRGGDYFPLGIFPEPEGLLPWGNDENGNDYYWHTSGSPTSWRVVQNENRGRGLHAQPFSMTGFLVAVLNRKVRALASGYPRKDNLVFESHSSRAT